MTEKELERRKKQLYENIYCDTRTISDKYPQVKRIIIEYEGIPRSPFSEKTKGHLIYTPNMNCHILIKCPNDSCTGIGFDLQYIIYDMIRKHETEKEGSIVCQNYEDAERFNKFHCNSELIYTIIIEYIKE